jgi:hypothetical protein
VQDPIKNLVEIDDLELFAFQEFVEAFCAQFDPTSREQRICLGDCLVSAHHRMDLDSVREIASALVNS